MSHDRTPEGWEEEYKKHQHGEHLPWDINVVDTNLKNIITEFPILPCNALDFGCGTGTDSLWLARQGFRVTGIDISETAIEIATNKAKELNPSCDFKAIDFVKDPIPNSPFEFIYDRGCFHCKFLFEDRVRMAKKVAENLVDNGLWFSLIGNADGHPPPDSVPPLSAIEIVSACEPFFEILKLFDTSLESKKAYFVRAWGCLLRKRKI